MKNEFESIMLSLLPDKKFNFIIGFEMQSD